jgi:hypothetical protein
MNPVRTISFACKAGMGGPSHRRRSDRPGSGSENSQHGIGTGAFGDDSAYMQLVGSAHLSVRPAFSDRRDPTAAARGVDSRGRSEGRWPLVSDVSSATGGGAAAALALATSGYLVSTAVAESLSSAVERESAPCWLFSEKLGQGLPSVVRCTARRHRATRNG